VTGLGCSSRTPGALPACVPGVLLRRILSERDLLFEGVESLGRFRSASRNLSHLDRHRLDLDLASW
jgi:hypothetical protein